MSTTTPREFSEKQRRIIAYLETCSGEHSYFKSRKIGEEIGLTAKEVGRNLREIADSDVDVGMEIDRWGYSSPTTWRVKS